MKVSLNLKCTNLDVHYLDAQPLIKYEYIQLSYEVT